MKRCSVCRERKELSSFYKQKDGALGVASRCKPCLLLSNKEWGKRNPDKMKVKEQKYREANRELMLARTRKWREENKEYDSYRSSVRRALKIKATPRWADKEKIKEIYLLCPKGFHVDHIIPLKSKTASGLHNEFNLQYLLPSINQSKGNRYHG